MFLNLILPYEIPDEPVEAGEMLEYNDPSVKEGKKADPNTADMVAVV